MDLQKKIGPLPLWGWIAAVIAGVGLAWVWSQRSQSSGSSQERNVIPGGTGPGTPGFIPSDEPEESNGSSGDPLTNEEWERRASEELIARGYDPGTIDMALRKYLAGQSLTVEQQAMINAAMRTVGRPPIAIPPPVDTGDPEPEPDPDPPDTQEPPDNGSPQSIVVSVGVWPGKNSSLWDIAETYYGDGTKWQRIYNANRNKISNPDLIYPGQRFTVPNPSRNV